MSEIIFNSNPFFVRAYWYEEPKIVLTDHWITKEFGFEVFKCGNDAVRWIYIVVDNKLYKATPEFLEDIITARLAFSKLKILSSQ